MNFKLTIPEWKIKLKIIYKFILNLNELYYIFIKYYID
jgi:hypothetical protein